MTKKTFSSVNSDSFNVKEDTVMEDMIKRIDNAQLVLKEAMKSLIHLHLASELRKLS
jgi:hypothetical protein